MKYQNASFYRVTKFDDIVNKIIPFFKKYLILGVKALDFADFCKAAELMKNKAHLGAPTPVSFTEVTGRGWGVRPPGFEL